MFRIIRRRPAGSGVLFCDACANVSTAAQRAERRRARTRDRVLAWSLPR
jgi:hypothetical protein